MANGHGGFRPGAGRKKNGENGHKKTFREELRAYCAERGVDPHKYLADLIADASDDNLNLKLQAARELAQYLEPKLKAVEHSGEIAQDIHITVSLD